MLDIRVRQDDYLEVVARGRLSKTDYDVVTPQLEAALKAHGKLRLMLRVSDLVGWTLEAFISELKFDTSHRNDFERVAILGSNAIHRAHALLAKPMFTCEVRYFDAETQEREALAWLEAPPDPLEALTDSSSRARSSQP